MDFSAIKMKEKLTEKDLDQLEQWIGTGPKTFTRIYSITRDGCDPEIFHQRCDRQGATVTVLYNKHNSVYGGYTSVSWQSNTHGYMKDDNAFLYQLRYNGNDTVNKFPVKSSKNAVFHNSDYGPTFGNGHDLLTFKQKSKGYNKFYSGVQLNGTMEDFGTGYIANGVSVKQINNGTMEGTELEVYLVTDGRKKEKQKTISVQTDISAQKQKIPSQWRKTEDWNEKFHNELQEEIVNFKPIQDLNISEARILMLGPVGAGKSSFFNTIDSIYRGRITQRAGSGNSEHSLTTTFVPYSIVISFGATLNFRLCDTRGLEETMGIDVLECNYLLDGNIPYYYEFNPTKPITPESSGFKSDPTGNDQVHCAVFVVDSTTLEVLSTKIVEKMKGLRGLMNQKGIPQLILLTKVDKLCNDVQKDVSQVFFSSKVEQAVDKASQLLGLPRANVLPVKNYENEAGLDNNVDILALLALRKMLHCSEDFMLNMKHREQDVQVEMGKLKLEK